MTELCPRVHSGTASSSCARLRPGAFLVLLAAAATAAPLRAWADDAPCDPADPECPAPQGGPLDVIKSYVTAPLRWDRGDWWFLGGTVAALGLAHALDGRTRVGSATINGRTNTHDLQDALPAAALFAGTLGYAELIDDHRGVKEAGTMLESAMLSVGAGYVFKYAAGRERPDQTRNPNRWEAGGSSFPSVHVIAATAIGTVMAESGGDEYRGIRRVLGYGVAAFTAYERIQHNAHWLSDTVAGAALGNATARFVMNRHRAEEEDVTVSIEPLYHGIMLSYQRQLP